MDAESWDYLHAWAVKVQAYDHLVQILLAEVEEGDW